MKAEPEITSEASADSRASPGGGQLQPGHLDEYPSAPEQVPETVVWGLRADLALQAPAPGIAQAPLGISQAEPGP